MIIALLMTALPVTTLAAQDSDLPYGDIKDTWLTDADARFGYPDIFSDGSGRFNPGRTVTRIEFVRALHKALDITINYFAAPDIADSFDDEKHRRRRKRTD